MDRTTVLEVLDTEQEGRTSARRPPRPRAGTRLGQGALDGGQWAEVGWPGAGSPRDFCRCGGALEESWSLPRESRLTGDKEILSWGTWAP